MTLLKAGEYVFPVMGGKFNKSEKFRVQGIYGTCFSIRSDIFLTAGHVVKEIEEKNLTLSIGKKLIGECAHKYRHNYI